MTVPTLEGAPFLADPALIAVLDAVETDGDRARVVGGAVRNTLMGEPVSDVDIATTARPETVAKRVQAAGLKAVPTGIAHGTVTVVARGRPFEVTTLRTDVATDGRRAVVAFTDDWAVDAARRDFTMNALYVDRHGTLFDPTGGLADALDRRVRFIGRPEDRIGEDYLRILRFFRFHARYGRPGEPDAAGLSACVAMQAGLDRLSRERIGQEMRKLVIAPGAEATLALMARTGILRRVFGAEAAVERFAAMRQAGGALSVAEALTALAAGRPEDADSLGERLRLSNDEHGTIATIRAVADRLGPAPDEAAVRLAVYRAGNPVARAALLLAAAEAGRAPPPALLAIAQTWAAPAFPLSGKDLLAAGHRPGPELGRALRALEEAWIAAGYGAAPEVARGTGGEPT